MLGWHENETTAFLSLWFNQLNCQSTDPFSLLQENSVAAIFDNFRVTRSYSSVTLYSETPELSQLTASSLGKYGIDVARAVLNIGKHLLS
jgi:hypothetical protein